MIRRLSALTFCAILSLGLAFAGSTTAQQPPGAVSPADEEEALRQHWQNKYRDLLLEVERTREHLEQDRTIYTKGRQRGRLRGGTREEVVSRIQEAEKRLAALEAELAAFPETARRAGIPPGWLRDVQR